MKGKTTTKTAVKKLAAAGKGMDKNGKKPTAPSGKKPVPGKKV